jgi:hypothetical protein
MHGVRHFLRNFTARAVREHLESQVQAHAETPALTDNELDLVRYVVAGQYDWKAFLDRRDLVSPAGSPEPGLMDREDEPPEQRQSRDERKDEAVRGAPAARKPQALELRNAG